MDDVAVVHNENEHLKKVRARLLQWEAKTNPLAALTSKQEELLEVLTNTWRDSVEEVSSKDDTTKDQIALSAVTADIKLPNTSINTTNEFLLWYDSVHEEIQQHGDVTYHRYLQQLESRSDECCRMLDQISVALERLNTLSAKYDFVSQKTSALNSASEKLIDEQQKLQKLGEEIQKRLHYFNQVELLHQRLQSPTLSVSSEAFKDCLNRIDECLEYLQSNSKFKDSSGYTMKYKQCLSKAISLIKHYCNNIMAQATEATIHPKQNNPPSENIPNSMTISTPDVTFALYYGKYQTLAVKIKRISQLIEPRINLFPEYEQLLTELQQNFFQHRAGIMSPAVDQAIKDIRASHKGDHCSLMRSTCAFLVHVCQDEQRLYYQFFSLGSEQLTLYLEGLCNILYDTMRPYIIHINHLETLAEVCSILRIEMLEEHVQQNPEALEAFGTIANQLLQDVQERLVFRAHLYLNSDILNYNPSTGDLAYPEKLEMMESIAMSLQEPQQLRRSDSRSSIVSTVSSAIEAESTADTAYRSRNMNSPADLHGMWYPTVRRTLVCLSRLYRCVDRPIFQGLSQEALKVCIQSVSAAATKIAAAKTSIDGELFEIKHLLILREQIAPFRVDFTVKETSLDFSKVKTAAFGLLQKRKQLFSMGSNNALLEFLLEGTPQIKEHLIDSRKEVDRQLKIVCEQFIKDATQTLVGPITNFIEKAQTLLANNGGGGGTKPSQTPGKATNKVNYILRETSWASPQQISSIVQETQRCIKGKLASLQRSMQLYLSNRDTEFIIFRPIRNNIIQTFVKLEQLLSNNGYTSDDMIIAGCPTAEQVSIMLSSASILAAEGIINFSATNRKISSSSNEGAAASITPGVSNKKFNFEKKISNDNSVDMEILHETGETASTTVVANTHEDDGNLQ